MLNFIVVIDTAVHMYHTMTFLFDIFLYHSWLCDSTKGWIVVGSLRKMEKMGWWERYKLLFPYLPGFTIVGIPVQCLQCIWWKHHINTDGEWIWPPNTLDWLKPLKTFWYNSMNAFLTLLSKIEKVNSSLKVSDFLVL